MDRATIRRPDSATVAEVVQSLCAARGLTPRELCRDLGDLVNDTAGLEEASAYTAGAVGATLVELGLTADEIEAMDDLEALDRLGDLISTRATAVNNSGPGAQVRYLMEQWALCPDTVVAALTAKLG